MADFLKPNAVNKFDFKAQYLANTNRDIDISVSATNEIEPASPSDVLS